MVEFDRLFAVFVRSLPEVGLHQALKLGKLLPLPLGHGNDFLLRNRLRRSRHKVQSRPHLIVIHIDVRDIPLEPPKIDLVQPAREFFHLLDRNLPVHKSIHRNLRIQKDAVASRGDIRSGLLQCFLFYVAAFRILL